MHNTCACPRLSWIVNHLNEKIPLLQRRLFTHWFSRLVNYKKGKNEEYLPPFNNMRFIIPIFSRPVYIYVRVDSGTSCVRHRSDKRFLLGSFCQSKSSSVAGLINQPKYWACYNSCLRVTPLQCVPSTETSAVASSPASFQTQMSLWTIFDNNSYHFLGYFLYNNAISHCGEKSWKSLMHETFWWEKVCTTEKGALRAIARIWRLLRHKEIKKKGIWSKRGYGDLGRAEKPTLRLARGVEYDSFFWDISTFLSQKLSYSIWRRLHSWV